MLEINLLPVREARRKADLRQYFMQFLLVLIVVCGGVGLFHSRLHDQIQRTEARVAQMQSDIDKFKPQLQQVEAFKKRKSELQKKIDIIDGLDRARSGPVRVLYEVASRTPDRLWLTGLSTKARQIKFQGQSLDNELVAVFLRKLGESEYFANVDLHSAKLSESRGLKLVRFEITADLVDGKLAEEAPAPKPGRGAGKRGKKGAAGGADAPAEAPAAEAPAAEAASVARPAAQG
jgi:type IV pilus assembly protein PilN